MIRNDGNVQFSRKEILLCTLSSMPNVNTLSLSSCARHLQGRSERCFVSNCTNNSPDHPIWFLLGLHGPDNHRPFVLTVVRPSLSLELWTILLESLVIAFSLELVSSTNRKGSTVNFITLQPSEICGIYQKVLVRDLLRVDK